MTSSTPKKKLLKGRESWNKAIPVLLIFVGYALVLGKTSYISAEDLFPRCSVQCGTRQLQCMNVTQLYNAADNLCSWVMFWNFASKKSSTVLQKQACISLLWQSADACRPLLTKTVEEILFPLFSLFFHDVFGRWNNKNNICQIRISFVIVQSWLSDFPQL